MNFKGPNLHIRTPCLWWLVFLSMQTTLCTDMHMVLVERGMVEESELKWLQHS